MVLTAEYIRICKLEKFAWANTDHAGFIFYSDIVANYYINELSFVEVIAIFDEISDEYLLTEYNKNKDDKLVNEMCRFYEKTRELYFLKFIKKYEYKVDNNNPMEIIDEYVEMFSPLQRMNKFKKHILKDSFYYRARLGAIAEKGSIDGYPIDFDYPYYSKDMINPPSSLASEGRFNRDGYSYYYLSSDKIGAIAEVRPKVGGYCSVATFKIIEDLELFEFGDLIELFYYFTKPVYEGFRHYRYTQFFSDIIYKCGFDGIQYSGVQTGIICIVCFYPKKINYVDMSENLYKIDSVNFNVSVMKPQFTKHPDWTRLEATNYKLDDERSAKIEHMIKHEIGKV
ncbi:MAG: RES family NAD+ phosphorylase [Bacilli bacterium]|nr:RES family NAD+ phosphorylase [Acholeplasmataceae bacterium]MDY2902959.1 RES family NAD+ phosphorylase [Bacilli bacterium]